MNEEVCQLPLKELGVRLRNGTITSEQLTEFSLSRIQKYDPQLHAFILVTGERAISDARRADEEFAKGVDRGPLHGIPYGLKDIFTTGAIPTTCNSRLLIGNATTIEAAVETRLRAGGAVLLGKLNTHEFAFGGPSTDLPFPLARNPWNLEHFSGGSSSGSAVAIAAGYTRVAIGSDTGGSIRAPASHCGVVGLKPTYGLIPTEGTYPLAPSLDHVGPLAASVEDAAIILDVITAPYSTTPQAPAMKYRADLDKGLDGLKLGYAREAMVQADDVSPELVRALDEAAQLASRLGADIEEVSFPDIQLFHSCGYIIMLAEAYSFHERYLKTRPYDYGRYSYQRLVGSASLSAAALLQAYHLKKELTMRLNGSFFGPFDGILAASALTPAPRLDTFPEDWPPPPHTTAMQNIAANVTGNPALAFPVGFSSKGLPIGMQIIGPHFRESTVLQIGNALERALNISSLRPNFAIKF